MKRLFSILAITGFMLLSVTYTNVYGSTTVTTVQEAAAATADDAEQTEQKSFTQKLKERFIQGGPAFMAPVLLCLILGLAIAIERIIYLNLSTTNSKKLIK